jgi:hypothetical protein
MRATAQTQNAYLRDIKSFCRWAVADGRLPQSPVEYLHEEQKPVLRRLARSLFTATSLPAIRETWQRSSTS